MKGRLGGSTSRERRLAPHIPIAVSADDIAAIQELYRKQRGAPKVDRRTTPPQELRRLCQQGRHGSCYASKCTCPCHLGMIELRKVSSNTL